ncbi:cellular morphogenesis protein [Sporothrix brasiliensis 5110]|uniref:Cellular morphogenesis protein n=1 Tax=Sporothrix brasiliensis 5110 TaxID=1398154 RepID=A0A0C2IS62_9PEZI|nr:cellular morphogenesis protein [Sporothrix brasiliensis 5110]KIH89685.1 cellular morphogenesis protein [Sporothrix brasiliensis 5110]
MASTSHGFNFTPAASSNIDLSSLGSIGIAGDFAGISLFEFEEQSQTSAASSSEGLLARLPNSAFATVLTTDASIMSMCSLVQQDGTGAGVVLGGNFTSLGDQQATAIALFNPNTSAVTPLTGLQGQVYTVFCDEADNSVFVGGNFIGPNSTNAIRWSKESGWTPLPFAGFNGPVKSITRASNGHIIFGGSFTGLGNASTPTRQDEQIVNIASANVSATNSAATAGFSDPSSIVCKTDGSDGAGNTWLLQDDTPGSWEARFSFGFQPSKLRLWNTHLDGRGTQTFRFTALPLNGIMNFTYIDPATGANATCTSECPLSASKDVAFQDFHFVNNVGMDAFRIDISAWYGSGGGLDGIELFENDIFAYAINDFNEPTCAVSASEVSSASTTGPWTVSPSFQSSSEYLTAQLASPISSSSASVVFSPDIRQSGNYTVNMYTPGCLQDNTCSTRGQVNITVSMVEGAEPTSVQLFQTNNYDKYDQIYFGSVNAPTGAFRPTVTLTPLSGQKLDTMTLVAQRVGFTLLNSTGGLNGLFEYDPTASAVNTSDFSSSAFDTLGATFATNSVVNALATGGDVTYIAGNFTSTAANNIISVNSGNSSSVQTLAGSLNGGVLSMVLNGTNLFVGGSFTSTESNSVAGLNHVAVFDTGKSTWNPLGAGVDGPVVEVVAMTMNVTTTTPEIVIAFTGGFKTILGYSSNAAVSVDGFAIWVPAQNNWLQNVKGSVQSVDGTLLSSLLDVPGSGALYGGSLSFAQAGTNGAATLTNAGVGSFGIDLLPSPTTTAVASATSTAAAKNAHKRDTLAGSSVSGVVTGLFDTNNGRNKTILGGHFSANSSSGTLIQNLLIIDNKNNGVTTGLGSSIDQSSAFVALAVTGDTLFAGGNVTGAINGASVNALVSYNIATDNFNTQPPSLTGGNGTVTSIQVRPSASDVYVGGTFASAGSLGCPGVCYFSTSAGQWNRPGTNLGTSSVNAMVWTTDSTLLAGGSLIVNNTVSTVLAQYDASKQVWSSFPGGDDGTIPGPVALLALGASDGSELWVAGTAAKNGSLFLMKYDGKKWTDAFGASGTTLGAGTDLRSLQVFSVTSNHAATDLLDAGQVLMLTGALVLPGSGKASAAVFNGKTFAPYALTTASVAGGNSIASIFVEHNNFFTASSRGHLPLVAIVLIGLGISLVLMLVIVAAGLLLDRIRKKRQGYVPAPSNYGGLSRIPPQELLESLGRPRPTAPQV